MKSLFEEMGGTYTLGADKKYNHQSFIHTKRTKISPHIA